MNWETIAEKILPTVIILIVGAMFTLYMDVQFLKAIAADYKARADKAHAKYEKQLESCTKYDIIQNKDIEFLKVDFHSKIRK